MRETSYHVVITEMTVRALWETQNVLDCIPDALWDIRFGGRPSGSIFTICCMSWISGSLTPMTLIFVEPPVHHPHLQNLSIYPAAHLDRRQIDDYFYTIKAKLSLYLTSLHDEDLLQRPENCTWTRFTLILAQFRHWHLHLGMLMGFVQADTGLCPRTLPPNTDIPTGPYDPYE